MTTGSFRLVPLLLASVSLTLGCPTSWHLERVEGELPSIHNDMWNEVYCASEKVKEAPEDGACAKARRPLVHCTDPKLRHLCQSTPRVPREPIRDEVCSSLRSIVSFAHLSDAQLKEHRIRIAGALTEAQYDGINQGSARAEALERNDDAVLLATTLAINELARPGWLTKDFAPCPPPAPPSFAIHTGDAVDSGMFSELLQFIAAMDALEMPWLNVVGNHDILFFGTFPSEHVTGLNVVVPYVPILDVDRFMRFHSHESVDGDPALPNPGARGQDHVISTKGCAPGVKPCLARRTMHHGFDYPCERFGRLCSEARGYYTFDLPIDAKSPPSLVRNVRGIVLNTSEDAPETNSEGFHRLSRANVLPEQIRWLEEQLSEAPLGTFFLVFGHHTLDAFDDDDEAKAIKKLMLDHPAVLAYLAGHKHVDSFHEHPRTAGRPLWEIVAGSTLIFPQLVRHVELLESPSTKELYLRVTSLRQRMSDATDIPALPAERCSGLSYPTSFCHRLANRARLGRRGAASDADKDADFRTEEQAVLNANGLMRVF